MQILRASEDYLETMLMMKEKHGYIRSIDIAEYLGVTKPSVSYATKRLRESGYITMDKEGLITLKEDAGLTATKADIAENPKNLDIQEIEAAQLPRSLQDVDLAVINGNYAIQAGLKVSDALAVEDKDSIAAETYANVLVVKEGNEETDATKALIAALQSDTVREFIDATYAGAVIAKF